MKNFMNEFKEFALKGNVMDLAVGVIIGGSFQAIIKSLIDNIINPIIGILFQADFSQVVIRMGSVKLGVGAFVSTIINFVLLAFVLFLMVKAINQLKKLNQEEESTPEKSEEVQLLEKILEQLKKK